MRGVVEQRPHTPEGWANWKEMARVKRSRPALPFSERRQV